MAEPGSEELPQLGRYQVIDKIAAGGMAEVFLAKAVGAMGFQRLVAIKLIHANFTKDEEFVKMFIDEARIAMHLHHRNIVQVFDLDKVGDTYFIAMEYVHGVNLYDLYERIAAKNRWIDPPLALYLIAEISKGLHFAHTRTGPDGKALNIIHRDVSPQNVLLSFEGEIKITDFGIATAAERLHQTAAGIVKGKYAYMAPERLEERPVDARVDVFSVGALLYELLVGENPFAGPSAVETIENVLSRRVTPPSQRGAPVSERLDQICLKALARKPGDRYPNAQALADEVTEYAMELTHARKDMAAGDSAVATLLAELFPNRLKPPSGERRAPVSLPGVSAGAPVVSTVDTSPDQDAGQTQEDLPTGEAPRPECDFGPEDGDDPEEAPTVLRMTPIHGSTAIGQPDTTSRDERRKRHPAVEPQDSLADADLQPEADVDKTIAQPSPTFTPEGPVPAYDDFGSDKTSPTHIPREAPPEATIPTPVAKELLDSDVGVPPLFPEEPSGPATAHERPTNKPELDRSQTVRNPFYAVLPSDSSSVQLDSVHRIIQQKPRTADSTLHDPAAQTLPSVTSESDQHLVVPVSDHQFTNHKRRLNSNIIAGISFFVAAIVVAAAALLMFGDKETARAGHDVPVIVQTVPAGASVSINGREQTQKTPLTIFVPTHMEHFLELRLDGYEPKKMPLTVEDNTAPEIVQVLTPLTGSITVLPTPKEATVIINGENRGTGNVNILGLPLNQGIQVVVKLKGYETVRQEFTLQTTSRNQTFRVPLQPKPTATRKGRRKAPKPKLQKVTLSAQDSWAVVSYNGRLLGTTPTDPVFLPIGRVRLRVRNQNRGIDRTITVRVPDSGPNAVQNIQLRF